MNEVQKKNLQEVIKNINLLILGISTQSKHMERSPITRKLQLSVTKLEEANLWIKDAIQS